MSIHKYTTLYAYCDKCDVKIENAEPYSKYCCDSCYNKALSLAVEPIIVNVDKKRSHYDINRDFCSMYGVNDEDIIKVRLTPMITNLSDLENNQEQICGFYDIKRGEHSLIYKHYILFAVACNFAFDNIVDKRQSILVTYKEEVL